VKLLIVDDEALARLRLRSLLDSLSAIAPDLELNLCAEAANADEALHALRDQAVDVVLLDIGLPGRDGLRLAGALKALPQPPAVVFVTAHAEHALQAFELEALDYLTKPVRRERLLAALQRVQQRMASGGAAAAIGVPDPVLVVSDRGRVLRLPVREVLYLKAEQKYVTLRTAAHTHVLDDALSDLELRLGNAFVRIHRNALVAVRAMRALELRGLAKDNDADGWAVRVAPLDEWLPVSRRQVAAVRAAIAAATP
jgi:two-component system, LytTR family, response regulator AlgR